MLRVPLLRSYTFVLVQQDVHLQIDGDDSCIDPASAAAKLRDSLL